MIGIIAAPLTRFKKEQHLALMTEMDRLIMKETIARLGLEQLYIPFSSGLAVENAAVEIELGSLTTGKMDNKDLEREDLLIGFTHLVENGLRHFDLTKQRAAEIVKHIIEKYGNLRRKPNAEETVLIRSLTNELLSPENLQYVTTLSDGMEWVTRTRTVNEEYNALYDERNEENNGTHTTTSLEAREIMDPCYNAIVRRINALAEVNGEANYISFINQLNGVIEDLKTTLTVQQTARNKQAQQSTIKVG